MSRKRAAASYSIPVERLDDRNLLILILERVEGLATSMSELTQAVSDLGAAVSGVTTRLAELLSEAQAEQEQMQTRLDALSADDAADKAAIAEGQQRVAALLSEAQGATTQIEESVANLNRLAQDEDAGGGETPVDPPVDPVDPVDPPVDPVDPPADGGETPPPADGGGDTPPPADNGGDTPPPADDGTGPRTDA